MSRYRVLVSTYPKAKYRTVEAEALTIVYSVASEYHTRRDAEFYDANGDLIHFFSDPSAVVKLPEKVDQMALVEGVNWGNEPFRTNPGDPAMPVDPYDLSDTE